jgi:hypothetical protein
VSFTIKIHNVPDAQLGALIARVNAPKTMRLEVDYVGPATASGKSNGRAAGDTPMRMTGKVSKPGTILHEGMTIFEKLEVDKGIGNVTVEQFKEQLKKRRKAKDLYTRLINEGYLRYHE